MAEFDAIFDACVAQLNTGAAMDACLALVPPEAAEVASVIPIAAALRSLGGPVPEGDPQAKLQARSRFLAHAKALSTPSSVTAEQALDASIDMLGAGASVEDCLDVYPHHAVELRLLLDTVVDLRMVGGVQPQAERSNGAEARQGFLARAATLTTQAVISIEDAFHTSTQMMAIGASLEACLEAFPQHAAELRSLLPTVAAVRQGQQQVPSRPPRSTALSQREAFLAAAVALKSAGAAAASTAPARAAAPPPWWRAWANVIRQPAWRGALAITMVLVLLFGFGRSAVTVASDALPGDAFYPVKRFAEQTRLALTLDEEQRDDLQDQFEQIRREEVALVVSQGREVLVQLPGVIQSIDRDRWTIFGLDRPVIMTRETVVQGLPRPGRRVLILAWSDGQGHLFARQVTIFEDGDIPSLSTPARPDPTATPTSLGIVVPVWPTPVRPTTTGTPWPTETATSVLTPSAPITPTLPTTPTATVTSTPSVSPSTTPSITPTGTPSGPRPVNLSGIIQEIHPDWWLIGGQSVRLDGNTTIDESMGKAEPGAEVRVEGMELPAQGGILATAIVVTKPAGTLQVIEFTGRIMEMNGDIWRVGDTMVDVGEADVSGNPEVGKVATVRAQRLGDEMWRAEWVKVQSDPEPAYIRGVIESMSGDRWVVEGTTVIIDSETQITGLSPEIGLWADVKGIEKDDGVHAQTIRVYAPTATPTHTHTPTPVPTVTTPPPTDTVTPEPTSTATPTTEPPTATPEPPTATPEPPTSTPEPPTSTPEPPATPEPAISTRRLGDPVQEDGSVSIALSGNAFWRSLPLLRILSSWPASHALDLVHL